jgi:hypothetical protein
LTDAARAVKARHTLSALGTFGVRAELAALDPYEASLLADFAAEVVRQLGHRGEAIGVLRRTSEACRRHAGFHPFFARFAEAALAEWAARTVARASRPM